MASDWDKMLAGDTLDSPADSVAVGNPARVIRPLKRDEERCRELAQ